MASSFCQNILLSAHTNCEYLLQTVAVVIPRTVVTKPFPWPHIELGTGALSAAFVAPGIMTQSYPEVITPKLPYPQQIDPCNI